MRGNSSRERTRVDHGRSSEDRKRQIDQGSLKMKSCQATKLEMLTLDGISRKQVLDERSNRRTESISSKT